MRIVQILLIILGLSLYALADADQYVTRKCYHVCVQGGCQYIKCQNPKCPGGACKFVDCVNPSCDGIVLLHLPKLYYHNRYFLRRFLCL
jgi:hypothetical protein